MIEALGAAGFPGVEQEGDTLWARLSASGPEFRVDPVPGGYEMSLLWPVRLSAGAISAWNDSRPEAPLDVFQGETRLRMATEGRCEDALHFGALAEEMIALCLDRRRKQRAFGDGEGW